ncbi:MAG TPA: VOC family protein [Conexibacter sp.]|nr:VOC family protein [Conexibacter sp.]
MTGVEILGPHHVGYVARDSDLAAATLFRSYGTDLARKVELPQYSLRAIFLSIGDSLLEIVEFTDPAIADERLQGADIRLDHVAYTVADVERAAASLRASGARFRTPDGTPVDGPIELAGARHLWTTPAAAPSVSLQLVEPLG